MAVRSPSRSRGYLALGLATAVSLLTASVSLAGSPTVGVDQGFDKHGPFGYVESEQEPAGTCRYGYDPEGDITYYNGVRKVTAEPPRARARAGRSSQRIAWRLVVQGWSTADSSWTKVGATDWRSKRATPTERAAFTRRGLLIDSWPWHEVYGDYRAKVELRWYGRDDATIVGRANLFPDHYAGVEGDVPAGGGADQCGATTG